MSGHGEVWLGVGFILSYAVFSYNMQLPCWCISLQKVLLFKVRPEAFVAEGAVRLRSGAGLSSIYPLLWLGA